MNTDAGVLSFPNNLYNRVTARLCDLVCAFLSAPRGIGISFDNRQAERCSLGCTGITVTFSRWGDAGLQLEVRVNSRLMVPSCAPEYYAHDASEWPTLIETYLRDCQSILALREHAYAPALVLLRELLEGVDTAERHHAPPAKPANKKPVEQRYHLPAKTEGIMSSNALPFGRSDVLLNQLRAAATKQVKRGNYQLDVTEDEQGAVLVFRLEMQDYKAGARIHVIGLQCRLMFVVNDFEYFATEGHFREVAEAYSRWDKSALYPTSIITDFCDLLAEVYRLRYSKPLPYASELQFRWWE